MKRGPVPARGFEVAIPIAQMRGSVMHFRQSQWYAGDFTIAGNGIFAVVRLRRAQRIRATIGEITRIFDEDIRSLATIPGGGPLVRELWLYSRHSVLRFFRLEETGLIEIDCYGFSFVNGKPVVPLTMPARPGTLTPVPAGPPAMGEAGSMVHPPAVQGDGDRPGVAAAGSRGPIAYWLMRLNAGKNPVPEKTNSPDPASMVKKTGTAGPGMAGYGLPAKSPGSIDADLPLVPGSDPCSGDPGTFPGPGMEEGNK